VFDRSVNKKRNIVAPPIEPLPNAIEKMGLWRPKESRAGFGGRGVEKDGDGSCYFSWT
jgi:hypothetical protein